MDERLVNTVRGYLESVRSRLIEVEYMLQGVDGSIKASTMEEPISTSLAMTAFKLYLACTKACKELQAHPPKTIVTEGSGRFYVVKPLADLLISVVLRGDLPLGLVLLELEDLELRVKKDFLDASVSMGEGGRLVINEG
ncbi:MAG: hypothetical protein DRJ98_06980 [Thermoprotei archaeon]|nr:MAG: hypothetical protein DRJ98_06980 [Thermoprotei archaeon]RLF18169.1 MAG: hypothetical protein DRN06_02145 [Thermoprotei archaeon]